MDLNQNKNEEVKQAQSGETLPKTDGSAAAEQATQAGEESAEESVLANFLAFVAKVKAWLADANRSHYEGIELLKATGCKNRSLLSFLSARDQEYQRAKLKAELEMWLENVDDGPSHVQEALIENHLLAVAPPTDTGQEPNPMPANAQEKEPATGSAEPQDEKSKPVLTAEAQEKVKELTTAALRLKGEIGKLGNTLANFPKEDNEGRAKVVAEQEKLFDLKKGIEKQIAALRGGKPLQTEPEKPKEKTAEEKETEAKILELRQQRQQLQSYIKRLDNGTMHKSKPANERADIRAKKQADLDEVKKTLALLETPAGNLEA